MLELNLYPINVVPARQHESSCARSIQCCSTTGPRMENLPYFFQKNPLLLLLPQVQLLY